MSGLHINKCIRAFELENLTQIETIKISAKRLFFREDCHEKELIAHDLVNLNTLDLSGKVIHIQPLESLIGKERTLSSSNRFFYTRDGKKLVFNAGNTDIVKQQSVGPNEAIYVLDLVSKKTMRISPEGFNAPNVYVTADDRIFYSASKITGSNFQIYGADLQGNIKMIVEKGISPTAALR